MKVCFEVKNREVGRGKEWKLHLKFKKNGVGESWVMGKLGIRRAESVSDILESNGKAVVVGLAGGI